ncbi:unnamed protein product, partial [Aphanomyces euteiches]
IRLPGVRLRTIILIICGTFIPQCHKFGGEAGQEDPNLGPTRTEAYNADTDMEPPSTNAVTESANVAYTESPLATLRKRDLEYRRLLHANSPDQRDPEKRSRSLPAEPNDDSMVSNSG